MKYLSLIVLTFMIALPALAKKKGSPPMASGAPGDRTCMSSKCHAGNDVNSGDAEIVISGLPQIYTPEAIYEITLSLTQPGARAWGFQVTVADSLGNAVGQLINTDSKNTQKLSDERYRSRTNRQYITHTQSGIRGPKKGNSPTWSFSWQAPAEASPGSSFFLAFNAANGNKKESGDQIYTRSVPIQAAK